MSDPNPNTPTDDLTPPWGGCKVKIKDTTNGDYFLALSGGALTLVRTVGEADRFDWNEDSGNEVELMTKESTPRHVGVSNGAVALLSSAHSWTRQAPTLHDSAGYLCLVSAGGTVRLGLASGRSDAAEVSPDWSEPA